MKKKNALILLPVFVALFASGTGLYATSLQRQPGKRVQTARVLITENGYSRNSLSLRKGVPARITFLRQTDATCATEIVIPAYGINKSLPLGRAVVVAFTPKQSGEFTFTCGMNMMRGKLIVR